MSAFVDLIPTHRFTIRFISKVIIEHFPFAIIHWTLMCGIKTATKIDKTLTIIPVRHMHYIHKNGELRLVENSLDNI